MAKNTNDDVAEISKSSIHFKFRMNAEQKKEIISLIDLICEEANITKQLLMKNKNRQCLKPVLIARIIFCHFAYYRYKLPVNGIDDYMGRIGTGLIYYYLKKGNNGYDNYVKNFKAKFYEKNSVA